MAHDVKKKEEDIYNISGSEDDEQVDPMSQDYIGIIANYFSVGLMIGGSTSLLYPILIIKTGATASLMTASYAVVMVFWGSCRTASPYVATNESHTLQLVGYFVLECCFHWHMKVMMSMPGKLSLCFHSQTWVMFGLTLPLMVSWFGWHIESL